MTVRLMNTIARETHGKSCGTLGIGFDDSDADDNKSSEFGSIQQSPHTRENT